MKAKGMIHTGTLVVLAPAMVGSLPTMVKLNCVLAKMKKPAHMGMLPAGATTPAGALWVLLSLFFKGCPDMVWPSDCNLISWVNAAPVKQQSNRHTQTATIVDFMGYLVGNSSF